MRLITRNTDYAIRALVFLSREKRVVSVSELVEHSRIPRAFLRRLLQTLNQEGILHSYKGNGGGFRLAKPAEKILLADLIRIFQGPIKLNQCLLKEKICPDLRNCLLKKRIEEIEKHAVARLKAITIKSLMKEEEYQQ